MTAFTCVVILGVHRVLLEASFADFGMCVFGLGCGMRTYLHPQKGAYLHCRKCLYLCRHKRFLPVSPHAWFTFLLPQLVRFVFYAFAESVLGLLGRQRGCFLFPCVCLLRALLPNTHHAQVARAFRTPFIRNVSSRKRRCFSTRGWAASSKSSRSRSRSRRQA